MLSVPSSTIASPITKRIQTTSFLGYHAFRQQGVATGLISSMRYYLSSSRLGAGAELLPSLSEVGRPVAYICNALDHVSDKAWLDQWIAADLTELKAAGVQAKRLDLRDYFDADREIERALADHSGVWLSGGNVFVRP